MVAEEKMAVGKELLELQVILAQHLNKLIYFLMVEVAVEPTTALDLVLMEDLVAGWVVLQDLLVVETKEDIILPKEIMVVHLPVAPVMVQVAVVLVLLVVMLVVVRTLVLVELVELVQIMIIEQEVT